MLCELKIYLELREDTETYVCKSDKNPSLFCDELCTIKDSIKMTRITLVNCNVKLFYMNS